MTKSELIQRLAERNPHLYLRDVEKIVDTIFDEITNALVSGVWGRISCLGTSRSDRESFALFTHLVA